MKKHIYLSLFSCLLTLNGCLYAASSSNSHDLEILMPAEDDSDFIPMISNALLKRVNHSQNSFDADSLYSFALNHDNSLLVTCDAIIDAHTGAVIKNFGCRAEQLAFHPTTNLLACLQPFPHNSIQLWNLDTGEKTLEIDHGFNQDEAFGTASYAFHPHKNILATGSPDGPINLWDTQTGALLKTITGEQTKITSLAFHPHGDILAAGRHDGSITSWNIQTDECKEMKSADWYNFPIPGNYRTIKALSFDSDGSTLTSGSGSIRAPLHTRDTQTGKLLRTLNGCIGKISFSPDGSSVLVPAESFTKICRWILDYRSVLTKAGFSAEEIEFLHQAAQSWDNNTEHPIDLENPIYKSILTKLPLLNDPALFLGKDEARKKMLMISALRASTMLVATMVTILWILFGAVAE